VYNTEYPIAEGAQYFEYLDVVVGSDDLCYFISSDVTLQLNTF
jgi:hypothetical protein